MKTTLTALAATILFATSANAAVLLGGWDGTNDVAYQSPSVTDLSAVLTASTGDITPSGGSFQSNDFTWGGTVLDTLPLDTGNRQIVQSGTVTPWSLTLVVTNNGSSDVVLDGLHFRVKKDINNQGPPSVTIAYTGDIAGTSTSETYLIPNGITNHTVGLVDLFGLTDSMLGAGESATFTWTTDAPQLPTGNTGLRIDNFAISGDVVVPEPASLAAGLLGLTVIAGRRRR